MNIEIIWLEYKAALKRFLHAKVANEADVEDLLQEILIKTHHNLNTLKDPKSVKSWLFQIANRTIIDFYRQKEKVTALNTDDVLQLDENNAMSELSECILPFIKALPKAQASLLSAIDIENKSQKEYAQNLGVSYSTLKSRVQKSRIMLKDVFDECCHFDVDFNGTVFDYERKDKK